MQEKTSGKKIGLALGSGTARGLAHIGVLEVLLGMGIHIDMISGTSMGSMVAGVYAKGESIEAMKEMARDLGSKRLSFLTEPTLPRTGLISGVKMNNALKSVFGDMKFEDLKIPFACSATDIESGREVVIDRGLVREGVRASCTVPVILAPIKIEGRYLVDGALVNPVPADLLKKMGADIVIAVNVAPLEYDNSKASDIKKDKRKNPNILSIAFQTVNIIASQRVLACLEHADIIISPQVNHIGRGDFHRSDELIHQGELAALACQQQLKSLITL
ncbi:MAG: patatin-like phospholipase family protein [Dehalococcoidales bacterium]|jgi:NTE family protein|nr:patatin-like phospholipase family protein [Dehalococcoidales bacterium]NLT28227.1 patatin-like phospholipase family protein [Dehalococcoidales bacterium]